MPTTIRTLPFKHVIVIIGENRTFDHVFATYQPTRPPETVWNLLSEGIIKADGSKGINFGAASQVSAVDAGAYDLNPGAKSPYNTSRAYHRRPV